MITSTGSRDITILKGDPVTLECETIGDPIPKVTWRKDNTVLNVLSIDVGHDLVGTGSLKIFFAELQDAGQYVCVSHNSAGSISKEFFLTVHGK